MDEYFGSFHDLPAEERANWYERVRRDTGQEFYDLPAEERASWHERAVRDGYWGEW